MAYVIKVEYEGSLRRLLASRTEKEDLSLAKLEARIRDLFKIPSTAQLRMTYKDKKNDVITVGNDKDLTDACVTQKINPLSIRVALVTTEKVSSTDHEAKEEAGKKVSTSTPEKVTRKTVKIVDPVFQRLLPPNHVPYVMQNIAKMMTSQIHVAKKEDDATVVTPSSTRQCKSKDPTGGEKKTEPNTQSQISNQALKHEVSSSSCSRKGVNAKEYKPCEKQPITGPRCAVGSTRSVVKLVRKSPAVDVGPASLGGSPLLVFGPRAARCRSVKTC